MLSNFVETITDGRLDAIESKQKGLELVYETVGNSSYGKLGQRVGQPENNWVKRLSSMLMRWNKKMASPSSRKSSDTLHDS